MSVVSRWDQGVFFESPAERSAPRFQIAYHRSSGTEERDCRVPRLRKEQRPSRDGLSSRIQACGTWTTWAGRPPFRPVSGRVWCCSWREDVPRAWKCGSSGTCVLAGSSARRSFPGSGRSGREKPSPVQTVLHSEVRRPRVESTRPAFAVGRCQRRCHRGRSGRPSKLGNAVTYSLRRL